MNHPAAPHRPVHTIEVTSRGLTMSRQHIQAALRAIVPTVADSVPIKEVQDNDRALRASGMTSLSLVRLVGAVEDRVAIRIRPSEASRVTTWRSLFDLIEHKTNEAA